ncbi:hypothetical protein [Ralstonia mannitolilytica]|uniref:hypothetical protein n=1 Tax=Ralstonia mannitolilytica TaxID=105219 RepID=UPI0026EF9B2A|nr:hypothetical protein [Ralstonia mannitolilytica]
MAKKKATTCAAALNQILVQIPGDDSASQRQRALMAMQTEAGVPHRVGMYLLGVGTC